MKTMRPQRVVLPLALLSAAFMLSCSEPGLDPVGLDDVGIMLNKAGPHPHSGGKTEDASFDVSFTGDVIGNGRLLGPNGGKNNLQNEFDSLVTINLTGFRKIDHTFLECFGGDGKFDAIMMVSQVTSSNTKDAQILFFFDALGMGTDPSLVNYGLRVLGTFDEPGDWLPDPGKSTTITGKTFVLAHSNGPGSKVACTGGGGIAFHLVVKLP